MARKIKFRAWDSEEKCMLSWDALLKLGASGWDVFDGMLAGTSPDKIMQWTGLQDKNGTDIYEGDIVRAWIDYGPGGALQSIYAIEIGPHGCGLQEWTFSEGDAYLPEVIGNIHKHPELLEQKQ